MYLKMGSSGHLRMFEDVWEEHWKGKSRESEEKDTVPRIWSRVGREPNKKYQMNFMQSLKVIRMMEFV